jgi:hypothetical protein
MKGSVHVSASVVRFSSISGDPSRSNGSDVRSEEEGGRALAEDKVDGTLDEAAGEEVCSSIGKDGV